MDQLDKILAGAFNENNMNWYYIELKDELDIDRLAYVIKEAFETSNQENESTSYQSKRNRFLIYIITKEPALSKIENRFQLTPTERPTEILRPFMGSKF